MKHFRLFLFCLVALALLVTVSSLPQVTVNAQAATPFASVAPSIPPAVGSPGVSLAWDTTNKLLVITFTVDNSAGVATTLSTISYNPHSLEGQNGGGALVSMGSTAVMCKHNLPADPLLYQIGTASINGTVNTAVTQCGVSGSPTCPTIPF